MAVLEWTAKFESLVSSFQNINTGGGILVLTAPRGPDPGVLDFHPGVDRHSTMGNVPGVRPRGNGLGPRGPRGLYFASVVV